MRGTSPTKSMTLGVLLCLALVTSNQATSPSEPKAPSLEELAASAKQRWIEAKRAEQQSYRSDRPQPASGKAPRPPRLPLQFKAKGRARIAYNYDGLRELLAVLHYDYPNRRMRQDLYYINPGKVQRYYTGIWDYRTGKQYMIFHRIKDYPLPSPHGCMIVPTVGGMLHPHLVEREGVWMGEVETVVDASVGHGNKRANNSSGKKSGKMVHVPTNHWFVAWGNDDWNYYESSASHKPIRLERHKKNVDIHFLHFEEGAHTVHPDLFQPEAVASAKCTPIGSSRSGRRGFPRTPS